MQFLWIKPTAMTGSHLERIRTQRGNLACVKIFRRTCAIHLRQAVDYLNDPALSYATLYLLLGEVRQRGLDQHLNQRNVIALLLTNQIIAKDPWQQRVDYLSTLDTVGQEVLAWMIQSGGDEHPQDPTYQHILTTLRAVYERKTENKKRRLKSAEPSVPTEEHGGVKQTPTR